MTYGLLQRNETRSSFERWTIKTMMQLICHSYALAYQSQDLLVETLGDRGGTLAGVLHH